MKRLILSLILLAIFTSLAIADDESEALDDAMVINCKSEYQACIVDCKNNNDEDLEVKECNIACEEEYNRCEESLKDNMLNTPVEEE